MPDAAQSGTPGMEAFFLDTAGGDRFFGHPSGEKGFQPVFLVLKILDGNDVTKAQQLKQLQILEIVRAGCHQVLNQRARLGGAGPQKNAHTRLNFRKHLFR